MMSFKVLFAAALLVPAGAATALGAWTTSEQASVGPLPARAPRIAVNARGDAAAIWVRGTRRDAAVVASTRPAGGAWSAPIAISRRGRPAADPEVAIDAQGLVVVVWRQVVRTRTLRVGGVRRHQAVYVARARERLIADARWSAITTLSSERQKVGPPQLAISDAGGAVATWHWGTGTSPTDRGYVGQVQFVERRTDGTWSGPRRLSRSTLCAQVRLPRVAVGPLGHTVIWWQCDLPADRSTALAVSRRPGEAFGGEVELPFRTDGDVTADLALSGDGRAVAVSADGDGALQWWRGDVTPALALARLPLLDADRVDPDTGAPVIAVNRAGDALSGWIDQAGRPRAAPIAADLGVGSPSTLGPAGGTSALNVAVGDGRTGVVAWIASGRVLASTRGADGSVGTAQTVSGSGVEVLDPPAVGLDAAGDATLLWTRVLSGRPVIERATSTTP